MATSSPSTTDYLAANFIAWNQNGIGVGSPGDANDPDPQSSLNKLQSYLNNAAPQDSSLKNWHPLAISSQISSQLGQNWDADGMYADAYLTGSGQIVIAFQGTPNYEIGGKADLPQVWNAFTGSSLKNPPKAFTDAAEFTYIVEQAAKGAGIPGGIPASQIYVTGHSLGGAEAQYVQWWSRQQSTIFGAIKVNPDPLGGGETFGAPGIAGYKKDAQDSKLINCNCSTHPMMRTALI